VNPEPVNAYLIFVYPSDLPCYVVSKPFSPIAWPSYIIAAMMRRIIPIVMRIHPKIIDLRGFVIISLNQTLTDLPCITTTYPSSLSAPSHIWRKGASWVDLCKLSGFRAYESQTESYIKSHFRSITIGSSMPFLNGSICCLGWAVQRSRFTVDDP